MRLTKRHRLTFARGLERAARYLRRTDATAEGFAERMAKTYRELGFVPADVPGTAAAGGELIVAAMTKKPKLATIKGGKS